ncbi:NCS1 family nucleobase:cation symporter-1 [Prauserella muralis]|uniref:Nitrate reductase n=1 Tax=Prauserella muralis TaxID=588067 RepID=A0A2V4AZF8_9PSEU|nr:NCS1 family nucleobase:cation symporter-1 [Prauserella muralis]PXY27123.1 nitrate reductase [Prauserella muralis]TWE23239.1 NCS1 family nucleobase:cation symporter-1 [Prauserella muralis]
MATPARTTQAATTRPVRYAPHLYNDDLAPVRKRTWGTYSIFALWMADTHAISNYTFAAGLFVLGLAAWQVFLALLVGITIVYIGMNLMGHAGHRTGVPFPVLARVSFGVYGANIPALIRAIIAIAWYGIQTWLASVALVVLAVQVFPGLSPHTTNDVLGLSTLGWAAFGFMWLVQLLILSRGMETIRKVQDWATGPLVWIIMLFLAGWLLIKAGFDISLTDSLTDLPASEQWRQSIAAVGLTIATFMTLILNYGDFARFTKSHRAYRRGNLLGLPLNFSLFALASVLTTAGAIAVFGEAITEPVEIVARIDNPWVTLVGAITFIVATVGINIVANFVSPAYDLANLAPKYLNFKRGGLISAVLAVLVMPWELYSNPVVVNYFLGGLAAFLAPLVAILLVDYYLVRRGHIVVDDLFTDETSAAYYYRRGFNPIALQAFLPAAVVSGVLALVPAFSAVAPFSWVLGVGIAGGIYYWRSGRVRTGPLPNEVIACASSSSTPTGSTPAPS